MRGSLPPHHRGGQCAGDFDALDALFAADMVDHNPAPGQVPAPAGFKQWMAAARSTRSTRSSFPDRRGTVWRVLAEGDLVSGRVTWRGIQRDRSRG